MENNNRGESGEFKSANLLLVYEFGNGSKYEIKVYQSDSVYHLVIFKDNLLLLDEVPKDTSMIDWAVRSLPVEISEVEFVTSEEYSPLFYRMTVFPEDNRGNIVVDSSKKVNKNRNFTRRLSKLQEFLIEYWLTTLSEQVL